MRHRRHQYGVRRYCIMWTSVVSFYFTVKYVIIVPSITSQVDVTPDVDVLVDKQRPAAEFVIAAESLTTVNCTERRHSLRLPDYVVSRCHNASSTCAQISCDALLQLDNQTIDSAVLAEYVNWRPAPITDTILAKLTSDCAEFRRSRGFDRIRSATADDFPLAFNILAHRDADQLARLLRAIYRPWNVYCIHVDALSSRDFRAAVNHLAACFDNVRLASKLESVVYAGFSRLQADITCMRDNLNADVHWRYLLNTAAQAFPLKTVEEMVQVLRVYNGSNDIEGIYGHRVVQSRFRTEWRENMTMRKMTKTGRNNPSPPDDIDVVRGSAYGIFSRDFVKFVLEDKRAQDLLDWARNTWSPDELYWSTLHHTYSNPHLHTPGSFSGYPSSKPWLAVYANWGETSCRGRYVHGVCVFGAGDLPSLVRRREFFANKFYADFQPVAFDCLDAWLQHKELCPPKFDYDYYSRLPFIRKSQQQLLNI